MLRLAKWIIAMVSRGIFNTSLCLGPENPLELEIWSTILKENLNPEENPLNELFCKKLQNDIVTWSVLSYLLTGKL